MRLSDGILSFIRTIAVTFFVVSILSCAAPDFEARLSAADQQAAAAGFIASYIETEPFTLRVYHKINNSQLPLRIYIEGDGNSWITRYRPSLNPTPHNPVALTLALADQQAENIVYLARPCHYRPTAADAACTVKYWTIASYGSDVVTSLNEAIDELKQQFNNSQLELVGFSGGGALALLLAAHRHDVVSVRTVAANIDVRAFTDYHKVSEMRESLNPVDFSQQLAVIPQLHFSGVDDQVVPVSIAESYLSKLPQQQCARLVRVADQDHHHGWPQRWPQLLQQQPRCDAKTQ
ncbi:alpha/beta hydrolase [Oceanicoccus sp. KOV_DT_Chl]|uniref:lipase family protein n=1 Tax=Oceanicoccus sp. KOV_DT_Chl TaxID=1904639 RepID=UPI000C7DCC01|nr:alpha/beta hydrolase [Oceanicoccus sp. KOV_DT_Chl]